MHKTFKRFGMEGQVGDDAAFPRLRTQYEHMVLSEMRDSGYVPILGLGPFWSTSYNQEKEQYDFVLSIHGAFVGRKEACKIEGISVDGQKLPRIPPTKLQRPSAKSE